MGAAQQQLLIHEYALVGAQARFDALRGEERQLLEHFPELGRRSARGIVSGKPAKKTHKGKKRGRRKAMDAKERAEVSARMTKYWANWRKANGKPAKAN